MGSGMSYILSSGLFIGYLNDVHRLLWDEASYIREVYKEKQMYTY